MGRLFLSSSSSDDGGSSSSRGFSIGGPGAGGCTGLEEKEEDEEAAASRRRSCCERDVFGGLRGRRAGCGGERGWVCGWEEEEEQALRVSLRRLRDMDGGGGAPAGPCRGRKDTVAKAAILVWEENFLVDPTKEQTVKNNGEGVLFGLDFGVR